MCAARGPARAQKHGALSKSVRRERKCTRGHDDWRRRADGHLRCAVCARERNREANRRWRKSHPERHREKNRRWAKANPERQRKIDRRARLRARYGLDTEDYEALRRSQKGGCAICRQSCGLVVDHCHNQGRGAHAVRGLLCLTCNTGLGMFRDRPSLLIRGAGYLRAAGKRRGRPPAALAASRKARGISASAPATIRKLRKRNS